MLETYPFCRKRTIVRICKNNEEMAKILSSQIYNDINVRLQRLIMCSREGSYSWSTSVQSSRLYIEATKCEEATGFAREGFTQSIAEKVLDRNIEQ